MRRVIAFFATLLIPAAALAVPPEKLYYAGEVKLSSAVGKPISSQVILLEKIQDPEQSLIIEHAIVVHATGKVEEFTMRLAVKKDSTFTISDETGSTEGSGKLFGPAWKWTYFKGTFKLKNGIQIDDENFLADDAVGSARKKLTGPDGKVMMYMDMSLKGITPRTFEILRAGLLQKRVVTPPS
jgi:hypothetical protein